MMNILCRVCRDIFYNPAGSRFLFVNNLLVVATFASVIATILETVPAWAEYNDLFNTVEYFAVVLFTFEYAGRTIAHWNAPREYTMSFLGIVDLLSILPSFLGFANFTFLKTVRVVRILLFLRMIRLAKLARLDPLRLHEPENQKHLYALHVRMYFIALFSAVTIFGTLLYVFEGGINPLFESIPLAMIHTAKVIMGGIAQHMPTTVVGDIITILTRFTGLLLFGLLISIVGDTLRRALFGSDDLAKWISGANHQKRERVRIRK